MVCFLGVFWNEKAFILLFGLECSETRLGIILLCRIGKNYWFASFVMASLIISVTHTLTLGIISS